MTDPVWLKSIFEAVKAVLPDLPIEGALLVVAHADYESGGGTAWAARNGNNLFNITTCSGRPRCVDGWDGKYLDQKDADWEFHADGSKSRIPQRWRAYDNAGESIRDYLGFLGHPRYSIRAVLGHLANGDLEQFCRALHEAGYFTLPLEKYVDGMKRSMELVKAALA